MPVVLSNIVSTNLEARTRLPKGACNLMDTDVIANHTRRFNQLRFAYPVVSRRSRGLSLGLNVNPDKVCNFDCPYCQVDRSIKPGDTSVDFDVMMHEVEDLLGMVSSGEIWGHPRFANTPPELRRLNDLAFAGDGEPTTYPRLKDAIRAVQEIRDRHGLGDAKVIVLTNALLLHKDDVMDALRALLNGPYEIWAKLDGGTQPWFEKMAGRNVKLENIVRNITRCARELEVTIQSLVPTLDGNDPGDEELRAIGRRVQEIVDAGGKVRLVQLYTTARKPSNPRIGMVEDERLDEMARLLQSETSVKVETYYGREWEE
jgi:wyosine [tRNA(Phe)-imidazoG37] synthetase (radical SAM superfamily)